MKKFVELYYQSIHNIEYEKEIRVMNPDKAPEFIRYRNMLDKEGQYDGRIKVLSREEALKFINSFIGNDFDEDLNLLKEFVNCYGRET